MQPKVLGTNTADVVKELHVIAVAAHVVDEARDVQQKVGWKG